MEGLHHLRGDNRKCCHQCLPREPKKRSTGQTVVSVQFSAHLAISSHLPRRWLTDRTEASPTLSLYWQWHYRALTVTYFKLLLHSRQIKTCTSINSKIKRQRCVFTVTRLGKLSRWFHSFTKTDQLTKSRNLKRGFVWVGLIVRPCFSLLV